MTAEATLDRARLVLRGASGDRNRIACWLARAALEQVVDNLLRARGRAPGDANMRSLLTCLEVAYENEPGVAERAEFAWNRLSNACHQHAYELSPSASEATGLVEAVGELVVQSEKG